MSWSSASSCSAARPATSRRMSAWRRAISASSTKGRVCCNFETRFLKLICHRPPSAQLRTGADDPVFQRPVLEPRRRGVLDAPPSRGMTSEDSGRDEDRGLACPLLPLQRRHPLLVLPDFALPCRQRRCHIASVELLRDVLRAVRLPRFDLEQDHLLGPSPI